MRVALRCAVVGLPLCLASAALAQFQEGEPGGAKLGESKVMKWKAGMVITASAAPCHGIVGYAPVPAEWPEQQVRVADEDISPEAKISYHVADGVKLMVVKIAHLEAGKQAKAIVTFECTRHTILPPDNTGIYVLPEPTKLDRAVRPYLAASPKIETRDPKIRAAAKEIGGERKKAWEKVEAIYDWVREHVQYEKGSIHKGALAALKEKKGDCEGMSSLFIAICRASNIPARLVWVPEHCYPEFYLLDGKGEGHWFPCQAAGTRAFGGIPETKPVLQKGDNFRPPYDRSRPQRYMAEHLEARGTMRPMVQWMRGLVE